VCRSIQLGTPGNNAAYNCLVYNYYGGGNATSCAVPAQGSGNNGNVTGYYYQDTPSSPMTSLAHTATYTYDAVGRLTQAIATGNSSYSQSYNYTQDASGGQYGNMSCSPGGSGYCPQVTFSASTNRIANVGSASAAYDAAGNITNDTYHTYTWDAENHLISVDGGSTASYVYNALGQRVSKTVGGTYRGMVYDAFGQLMEYNNGHAETQDFMWLQGRPFASYVSGTRFLHPNALGSTLALTDHYGNYTQDAAYYPWGTLWMSAGTMEDERFAAMQKRDAETGLDPTPNRMYHWRLGRWLSPDPLGGDITNPQSLNRYAYALNNPTSLTDPLGLWCEPDNPTCGSGDPTWTGRDSGGTGALLFNGGAIFTNWLINEQTERWTLDYIEGWAFGGAGGGGGCTPTLPKGTPAKYVNAFNSAFTNALQRLADPECAALFGEGPVQAFQSASYSFRKLGGPTVDGEENVSVTGAATFPGTPPSVFINTQGPFMTQVMFVPGKSGPQTLDMGTGLRGADFGGLLLLHELGHVTGKFGRDVGNAKLNRAYTQMVLDHCF
jgi:RHS repeat-associated protein